MVNEKAVLLPRSYGKSCEICLLIDTQAPDTMKWYTFKEGVNEKEDKHICEECSDGLKEIRKKCHQKVDNPQHDIFKDFIPWFFKSIPGLEDAYKENQIEI